MSEEIKLLPCPFCKEPVGLQLCDSAGNFREPEYEEEPWSGLGFQLIHKVKDGECPIATHEGESLGSFIYDTKETAIAAWNRRTPEPGTSVVRWVRYDGTSETLPEKGKIILVKFPDCNDPQAAYVATDYCIEVFGADGNRGKVLSMRDGKTRLGYMWASLPMVPESANG